LYDGLLRGRSFDEGDEKADSGLPNRITTINPTINASIAHAPARATPFIKRGNCKRIAVFITLYFRCNRRAAVIVSRLSVKVGKRQEIADFESADRRGVSRIASTCPAAVQRCDTMDAITFSSVTKVCCRADF
jgi:hypothetical protein